MRWKYSFPVVERFISTGGKIHFLWWKYLFPNGGKVGIFISTPTKVEIFISASFFAQTSKWILWLINTLVIKNRSYYDTK